MRKITDEEFASAMERPENILMINKVCNRFKNTLSRDERQQIGRIALFKCLLKHKEGMNTKFTSSLFLYTLWECYKSLDQHKEHIPLPPGREPFYIPSEISYHVRECLGKLPSRHRKIIEDYYFKRMTLKEIGDKNGYTRVASSQNLKKAREAFRKIYQG